MLALPDLHHMLKHAPMSSLFPLPSRQVVVELGGLKLPLPIKTDARGFVEWLYLDDDFRISRVGAAHSFMHS